MTSELDLNGKTAFVSVGVGGREEGVEGSEGLGDSVGSGNREEFFCGTTALGNGRTDITA